MATKVGKVGDMPLIKLLDPSIMWFCKFKWHVKCLISLLALDQWPSNMTRW